jgi:hypothetical protein
VVECSDATDETATATMPDLGPTRPGEKPCVVVLGTGWAACRFLKAVAGGGARPPLLPPPPARCSSAARAGPPPPPTAPSPPPARRSFLSQTRDPRDSRETRSRCAAATKGGDGNWRWDFSPPFSPGRRVAVASPWSTVSAAPSRDRERGRKRRGEEIVLRGILTCGTHMGPTLTQPPRRINPASILPWDLG